MHPIGCHSAIRLWTKAAAILAVALSCCAARAQLAPVVKATCEGSRSVVFDGQGGSAGFEYNNVYTISCDQGTGDVPILVKVFSRESPLRAGKLFRPPNGTRVMNPYNDTIQIELSTTGHVFSTRSYNVNAKASDFAADLRLPARSFVALSGDVDMSPYTVNGPAPLYLKCKIKNVGDAVYGSGVEFFLPRNSGVGYVYDIILMDPAKTGWALTGGAGNLGDRAIAGQIYPYNKPLRFIVQYNDDVVGGVPPCPLKIDIASLTENNDPRTPLFRTITLGQNNTYQWSGLRELRVTITRQQLQELTGSIQPGNDRYQEFMTFDRSNASWYDNHSNRRDADAFERAMFDIGAICRGKVRESGDNSVLPVAWPMALNLVQYAGLRPFWIESGDISTQAWLHDQADVIYLSAHGDHRTGIVSMGQGVRIDPIPDLYNTDIWRPDLDTVVIAGCAVLDIGDRNGNYAGDPLQVGANPGLKWIDLGPKVLCGYNWIAPYDYVGRQGVGKPNFTADIAARYVRAYRNFKPEPEAWGIGNASMMSDPLPQNGRDPDTRPLNACAIDVRPANSANHKYWFFDWALTPPAWVSVARPLW